MRLIKMLGLAAVAALAAMAFAGAPSAMAESTALCIAHEDPCKEANIYTGHIEGLAENPELLTTTINVKCEHSVILGNALGLATPQVTHLELIDFTGDCLTGGGTSCTVTTVALGLLLLLKTKLNLGELESHETEVKVKCGFAINCTYGGLLVVHAEGAVEGGLGTITANEAPLTKTGGTFCPATSKWDAVYKIAEVEVVVHKPVYITT